MEQVSTKQQEFRPIPAYTDAGAQIAMDAIEGGFEGSPGQLEAAVIAAVDTIGSPLLTDRQADSLRVGAQRVIETFDRLSQLPYFRGLVRGQEVEA